MIFQCSLASPRMCRQFPSGPLRCHQLFRLCSPVQLRAQSRRASQAVLLVVSQALCRRLYRRVSRVHRQVPIPQRCQVRYLRLYLLRYQVDTRLPSPVFSLQLCPQAYQAAILQLDHQLFRQQCQVFCPRPSLHPPLAYFPVRNRVERLRLPRALRRQSTQGLSCVMFIIGLSSTSNKQILLLYLKYICLADVVSIRGSVDFGCTFRFLGALIAGKKLWTSSTTS